MILANFGLWHSGAKLSYLRYLTFKSLRHFHPHSRIQLFTNHQFSKDGGIEEQDYVNPQKITVDYMDKLKDLDVEIIRTNQFSKCSCNHQSDLFRYQFLKSNGGFYLDTDQIVLRSFSSLPLKNYKFIYSSYKVNSPMALNNRFAPVGILGASQDSKILNHILHVLPKYYDPKNYNCIGPLMFLDVESKIDMSEGFNAPSSYFYPAAIGDQMGKIFDGSLKLGEGWAVHWFGGYSPSQKFNRNYTEEFAKKSKDSISVFLREKKII
jgi:hypothetical protein